MFEYRYYRYAYFSEMNQVMPLSDSASQYTNKQLICTFKDGLNSGQVFESVKRNGLNSTLIPERSALRIILEEVLSPFYLFQVFSISLWFWDEYLIYASVILSSSLLSIMMQVRETQQSTRRLRGISTSFGKVKVLRDNNLHEIDTREIVFGDTVYLEEESLLVPCDLLVLEGSAIVNESMLTGESIPVIKTHLEHNDAPFIDNRNHIIYSGTRVLQQTHLKTLAIRTGFHTLKGNLIRSILFPRKHSNLSFYADSIKFILVLASMALLSFVISLPTFIAALEDGYMSITEIFVRSLDLLTICVPPALPTALSFGISFALKRLKKQQIYCINPDKINGCGKVNTVCFDKTGTLTEEGLTFKSLRSCNNSLFEESENIRLSPEQSENCEIQKVITASCHSVMSLHSQLLGDPLDIEMFQQTGYLFSDKFESVLPDGTKVIQSIHQQSTKILISKRFQFESDRQMMSVLAIYMDQRFVFSKGSPEKIESICVKSSIPQNFQAILQEYTMLGYRVIALSYRLLESFNEEEERGFYENGQVFGGFLIFENKLKPVTHENIQLLKTKKVRVLMITGDAALTATQIAKSCGIISLDSSTRILDSPRNTQHDTLNGLEISANQLHALSGSDLTVTGSFFAKHLSICSNTLLLQKIRVYARMKPEQKQRLVHLLQREDDKLKKYRFVAMCGDGANDCSALKQADMGVSLSETEASIAAAFTSKVQDISCVEKVLREGRASLVTSFQCFKYMALYSIIQCITTTILYLTNSMPTDFHFLFWDLFIILPLAFMLGLTKAADHLTHNTPTAELFSHEVILSITGQTLIQLIFQTVSVVILRKQEWHMDSVDMYPKDEIESLKSMSGSYESATLFWIANIQYISVVISFSLRSKFKKPFYTNIWFTAFFVFILLLSILTILIDVSGFSSFFQLKVDVEIKGAIVSRIPYSWRVFIGILCLINMVLTLLYETYLLQALVTFFKKSHTKSPKSLTTNINMVQLNNMQISSPKA